MALSFQSKEAWMHCGESVLALLFFLPYPLIGQTIPPDREILEKSEGGGMAMYADMNGYPGPKHVLEMVDQLDLSDQQVNDIQAIFDEMSERARAKGKAIIAREQQLDDLFQSGKADQETVERLSREIGTMRGELRAIHLVAHLSAAQVLSPEQTEEYNALRHGSHDPEMHH